MEVTGISDAKTPTLLDDSAATVVRVLTEHWHDGFRVAGSGAGHGARVATRDIEPAPAQPRFWGMGTNPLVRAM